MPDSSPTARALLTLELLQSTPGITAERLASRLGVTERAVRRYVGILREAGIPVESVRGPYGGYRLGRGLRLPPLVFSATEALGLVMAVLDGHHDAGDPTDPVGAALGKIVRALPGPVAAQAEAVRRTAAPAPDRAAARPDPATTTALVDAVSERRVLRLEYRTEHGSQRTFDVDPWAVVVRHGRWYLLCRAHGPDEVRSLRVDRVRALAPLPGSFSPPPDLDPVGLLEQSLAVGWQYDTEVVLDAPPEQSRRWLPRSLGSLSATEDGGSRLVGTTGNPYYYVEQLVHLPTAFRVVGGPELREAVRVVGQRLLDAAGDGPGVSPGRTT